MGNYRRHCGNAAENRKKAEGVGEGEKRAESKLNGIHFVATEVIFDVLVR